MAVQGHTWMHAGEAHGKWDNDWATLCASVGQPLVITASGLRESSSAQWCHCTCRLTRIWVQWHCREEDDSRRKQQGEADWQREEWGCAYIVQPLTALVPWLISSSSLHFYLMITHAGDSWIIEEQASQMFHQRRHDSEPESHTLTVHPPP